MSLCSGGACQTRPPPSRLRPGATARGPWVGLQATSTGWLMACVHTSRAQGSQPCAPSTRVEVWPQAGVCHREAQATDRAHTRSTLGPSLTRAQRAEVLHSLGHRLAKQAHHNPACVGAWVRRVCGLGTCGWNPGAGWGGWRPPPMFRNFCTPGGPFGAGAACSTALPPTHPLARCRFVRRRTPASSMRERVSQGIRTHARTRGGYQSTRMRRQPHPAWAQHGAHRRNSTLLACMDSRACTMHTLQHNRLAHAGPQAGSTPAPTRPPIRTRGRHTAGGVLGPCG